MFYKYLLISIVSLLLSTANSAQAGFAINLTSGSNSLNLAYDFQSNTLTSNATGNASLWVANYSNAFGPTISLMGRVGAFYIPVFHVVTNFPGENGVTGSNITDISLTAQLQEGNVTGRLLIDVLIDDWLLPGTSGSELLLSNSLNHARVIGDGSIELKSFYDIGSGRQYTDPVFVESGDLGPMPDPTNTSFFRGPTYDMGHTVALDLSGFSVARFSAKTNSLSVNSQASLPEVSSLVGWALGLGVAALLLRSRKLRVQS